MADDDWANAPAAPAATAEDSEDSDQDFGRLHPREGEELQDVESDIPDPLPQLHDPDVPDAQGLLPPTNDDVTTDEEERLGRQRVLTRHYTEHPTEDVDSELDAVSVDMSPKTRLTRRGLADAHFRDPEFFQYFNQYSRSCRALTDGQLLRNFKSTDARANTLLQPRERRPTDNHRLHLLQVLQLLPRLWLSLSL